MKLFFADKQKLFRLCQCIGWFIFYITTATSAFSFYGSFLGTIAGTAIVTLLGLVITLILRILYRRLWAGSKKISRSLSWSLVSSLLLGFIWNSAAYAVIMPLGLYADAIFSDIFINMKLPSFWLVTFLAVPYRIAVLFAWSALYFSAKALFDYQQEHEQKLLAQAQESEAKLAYIRSRLHPHFLFNILNAMDALIDENPAAAKNIINELSDYLRYSFKEHTSEMITVGEELSVVKSYLSMEKIRFEEQLQYDFNLDDSTSSSVIPVFILLPLVENAIKFGRMTSPQPLQVKITSTQQNGTLEFCVENTGHWVIPELCMQCQKQGVCELFPNDAEHQIKCERFLQEYSRNKTGLTSVRKRLETLYPGKNPLTTRTDNGWVRVQIQLAKA